MIEVDFASYYLDANFGFQLNAEPGGGWIDLSPYLVEEELEIERAIEFNNEVFDFVSGSVDLTFINPSNVISDSDEFDLTNWDDDQIIELTLTEGSTVYFFGVVDKKSFSVSPDKSEVTMTVYSWYKWIMDNVTTPPLVYNKYTIASINYTSGGVALVETVEVNTVGKGELVFVNGNPLIDNGYYEVSEYVTDKTFYIALPLPVTPGTETGGDLYAYISNLLPLETLFEGIFPRDFTIHVGTIEQTIFPQGVDPYYSAVSATYYDPPVPDSIRALGMTTAEFFIELQKFYGAFFVEGKDGNMWFVNRSSLANEVAVDITNNFLEDDEADEYFFNEYDSILFNVSGTFNGGSYSGWALMEVASGIFSFTTGINADLSNIPVGTKYLDLRQKLYWDGTQFTTSFDYLVFPDRDDSDRATDFTSALIPTNKVSGWVNRNDINLFNKVSINSINYWVYKIKDMPFQGKAYLELMKIV